MADSVRQRGFGAYSPNNTRLRTPSPTSVLADARISERLRRRQAIKERCTHAASRAALVDEAGLASMLKSTGVSPSWDARQRIEPQPDLTLGEDERELL